MRCLSSFASEASRLLAALLVQVVHFSWVNPKLEARVSPQGSGVFALEDVPQGEHLVVWTGRILSTEQALPIMNTNDKHYILQVSDGFPTPRSAVPVLTVVFPGW